MTKTAHFSLNTYSYSRIYIQLRITIHLKTLSKSFFLRLNLTSCLTVGGMVPRDQCPQTSWYDSRSFQTGKTCFRRLVDSGHCRFRHEYEIFAYFRCSALGKSIFTYYLIFPLMFYLLINAFKFVRVTQCSSLYTSQSIGTQANQEVCT